MTRLVTFITGYDEENPSEINGNEFFKFKTDEQKYIKVGVTEDSTFGISEFTNVDELIDWVDEQRMNNVQRQINSGWEPPEGYTSPAKTAIADVVQPVWEAVFG